MKKWKILSLAVFFTVFFVASCQDASDSVALPSEEEAVILGGVFETVFDIIAYDYFPAGISVSPAIPRDGFDDPLLDDMYNQTYRVSASDYAPELGITVNGYVDVKIGNYDYPRLYTTLSGELTAVAPSVTYDISAASAGLVIDVVIEAGVDGSGSVTMNGVGYTVDAVLAKLESLGYI